MRFTNKSIGLGTLALSGKYSKLTSDYVESNLKNINCDYLDFIDWAFEYKNNGIDVLEILNRNDKFSSKKLIYKFGRSNNLSISEKLQEIQILQKKRWKGKITYMFHNPKNFYYKDDLEVIKFIKEKDNKCTFGISFHNYLEVLDYLNNPYINIVQIPYNAIDFEKFKETLKLCKDKSKTVQVRSVLGAGLFTDKYCNILNFNFNDGIRSQWNKHNLDFNERMKKLNNVKDFLEQIYFENKIKISLVEFMIHFIKKSNLIDSVICGGSNNEQIKYFIEIFSTKNKNLENFFPKIDDLEKIIKSY